MPDCLRNPQLIDAFCRLKESLENKIEALEAQNTRLKAGNEDLLKQLAEANAKYSSLSADESERQKQLDKLTTSLNIAQRQATNSEKEIDELKRQVQEESTVSVIKVPRQLSITRKNIHYILCLTTKSK